MSPNIPSVCPGYFFTTWLNPVSLMFKFIVKGTKRSRNEKSKIWLLDIPEISNAAKNCFSAHN